MPRKKKRQNVRMFQLPGTRPPVTENGKWFVAEILMGHAGAGSGAFATVFVFGESITDAQIRAKLFPGSKKNLPYSVVRIKSNNHDAVTDLLIQTSFYSSKKWSIEKKRARAKLYGVRLITKKDNQLVAHLLPTD